MEHEGTRRKTKSKVLTIKSKVKIKSKELLTAKCAKSAKKTRTEELIATKTPITSLRSHCKTGDSHSKSDCHFAPLSGRSNPLSYRHPWWLVHPLGFGERIGQVALLKSRKL